MYVCIMYVCIYVCMYEFMPVRIYVSMYFPVKLGKFEQLPYIRLS